MADRTGIEWTDATWNPIRARNLLSKGGIGWHCEKVSDGCKNCYAEPMNRDRFGTGLAYKPGNAGKVDVYLDEDVLRRPLSWRRPRKVFPCSMTDIFGDWVSDETLDRIFATMLLAPQHTYQVLTKRPSRMRDYIGRPGEPRRARNAAIRMAMDDILPGHGRPWALQPRNAGIWLGISAEDQRNYDERREAILALAGGFPLFVSAEPLLGPLDLRFTHDHCDLCGGTGILARWPKGKCHICGGKGSVLINGTSRRDGYAAFSWVICGGESGPGARPMHPDWARSLRDQCAAAGTAFFFKQHGEWLHEDQVGDGQHPGPHFFRANGEPIDEKPPFAPSTGRLWHWWEPNHHASIRIGKTRSGRLLDGVEHNAMPEARA